MVHQEINYMMMLDQIHKENQLQLMNQEMMMNLMKVIYPNDEQMNLK
jgi:hypothetical protein